MRLGLVLSALLLSSLAGCVVTDSPAKAPSFVFRTDPTEGRLIVESAAPDLRWEDIILSLHDCGPDFPNTPETPDPVVVRVGAWEPYTNQAATSSGLQLNDPDHPGFCSPGIARRMHYQAGAKVNPHEFLEFCSTPGPGAHDLSIRVLHAPTGHRYGNVYFSNYIDACA